MRFCHGWCQDLLPSYGRQRAVKFRIRLGLLREVHFLALR